MKVFFLLLSVLYMLYAKETLQNSDPYKDIKYFQLDNGMQVYLLSDQKAERTSIQLSVNIGYGDFFDSAASALLLYS